MFITICHKLFLVNGSQWLISWNSTLIHGFHQMYFFLDWHSIFHQVALFLWDWPDYPTIYTNLCYRFPTRFELTCGYWTDHFLNHKQVLQVIRPFKERHAIAHTCTLFYVLNCQCLIKIFAYSYITSIQIAIIDY